MPQQIVDASKMLPGPLQRRGMWKLYALEVIATKRYVEIVCFRGHYNKEVCEKNVEIVPFSMYVCFYRSLQQRSTVEPRSNEPATNGIPPKTDANL